MPELGELGQRLSTDLQRYYDDAAVVLGGNLRARWTFRSRPPTSPSRMTALTRRSTGKVAKVTASIDFHVTSAAGLFNFPGRD